MRKSSLTMQDLKKVTRVGIEIATRRPPRGEWRSNISASQDAVLTSLKWQLGLEGLNAGCEADIGTLVTKILKNHKSANFGDVLERRVASCHNIVS